MTTVAHLIHLKDSDIAVSDEFLTAAIGYLSHELTKLVNTKEFTVKDYTPAPTPLTEWLEKDDDHRVLLADYLLEIDESEEDSTHESFFDKVIPLLESTLAVITAVPEYVLLIEWLERDKEEIKEIQTHRYREFFFVIITYKDSVEV